MFHAPIGRFKLEIIISNAYFSTVVIFNGFVFLSCRHFVVITTFSTGTLDGTPSTAQAERQKKLQHPTRPIENVVTTKNLQERKTQLLNGTTVEK